MNNKSPVVVRGIPAADCYAWNVIPILNVIIGKLRLEKFNSLGIKLEVEPVVEIGRIHLPMFCPASSFENNDNIKTKSNFFKFTKIKSLIMSIFFAGMGCRQIAIRNIATCFGLVFNPSALLYTPGLKVPMPEHLPQGQGVRWQV